MNEFRIKDYTHILVSACISGGLACNIGIWVGKQQNCAALEHADKVIADIKQNSIPITVKVPIGSIFKQYETASNEILDRRSEERHSVRISFDKIDRTSDLCKKCTS